MMTNEDFLEVIKNSFHTYLRVGTSRSTAKLKTLHGLARIFPSIRKVGGMIKTEALRGDTIPKMWT